MALAKEFVPTSAVQLTFKNTRIILYFSESFYFLVRSKTENIPNGWLTPQMTAMARAGLGQSLEPTVQPRSVNWVTNTSLLEPALALCPPSQPSSQGSHE